MAAICAIIRSAFVSLYIGELNIIAKPFHSCRKGLIHDFFLMLDQPGSICPGSPDVICDQLVADLFFDTSGSASISILLFSIVIPASCSVRKQTISIKDDTIAWHGFLPQKVKCTHERAPAWWLCFLPDLDLKAVMLLLDVLIVVSIAKRVYYVKKNSCNNSLA